MAQQIPNTTTLKNLRLTGDVGLTGNVVGNVVGDLTGSVISPADSGDGLGVVHLARATYDFAEHGGAISAIGLGVTIPDNAIVLGGLIDVLTTLTTAGADAGTIAVHVQTAGDIVAAVAVSDGANPWDAGLHAVIPAYTAATAIKLTAAREITATIAGQAVTAGKFEVFLLYVLGS